jgi:hypothetical protein
MMVHQPIPWKFIDVFKNEQMQQEQIITQHVGGS